MTPHNWLVALEGCDALLVIEQAVAAACGWSDLAGSSGSPLGHGFHATKQGERYTLSEPARRTVLVRLLVRSREDVSSSSLRRPDMLPPAEIRAAIVAIVDAHHGAMAEEIPVAVARTFGFKSTSSQLRAAIESQVAKLLRQSVLEENEGMPSRCEAAR